MTIDWAKLSQFIARHDRFLVSSHVRPDADAIGSCLGMAYLLESLGKQATIVSPSAVPPSLAFLDPERKVKHLGQDIHISELAAAQAHMIVDTSAWAQLADVGKWLKSAGIPRAVVDHHVSNDDLGAELFKDTKSEATGALVFQFSEYLKVQLSHPVAVAVFAAIATDTGWFRFSATSGETMRTIGKLIDLGVRQDEIYRELYEQATLARMRLFGRALGRITIEEGGQLAFTWVTAADFSEFGAVPSDTEDLVNECLKITGTRAAFIAIEQPTGAVKVSFRSRNALDVAKVAESFGGGGHKQAAGATLVGPLEVAKAQALTAMHAAVASARSA
jgi:bifunctional oligoribonuclease and PAP phosphatase NrnA